MGTAALVVPYPIVSGGTAVGGAFLYLPEVLISGNGGDYASIVVEIPSIFGEAREESYGSASLLIPTPNLSAFSYPGSYGEASLSIPVTLISGSGGDLTIGDATLILMAPLVSGSSHSINTLILNTDTGEGPFPYSNFEFNSMMEVDGRLFLASSQGLFELIGENDNGSEIVAYFETLQDDFGISEMKNVSDLFVGLRAGKVSVRTKHDGVYSNAHDMSATSNQLITKRAKLGLGLRQRYWGVKVMNVAGSSFKVDSLELLPILSSRKINQ